MLGARLIISVYILLASISIWAQPSSGKKRNISTVNGLSNNIIYSVAQDKLGFIWFATEDGLNRYDGYTFTVFRHDPADSLSISGNFTQCIYSDTSGNLWVGTSENGMNQFNYQSNTFKRIAHNPSNPHSLSNNDIVSIGPASDGSLWVASYRGGINNYNPRTGKAWLLKDISKLSKNPNYLKVTCVKESSDKILWIGTQGNGLFSFNLRTKKSDVYYFHPDNKNFTSNSINCILEDAFHNMWVATNNGLGIVKPGGGFIQSRVLSFFTGKEIFTLLCDRQHFLWVGTDQGVFRFSLDKFRASAGNNAEVEHVEEAVNEHGLSYRSVRSLFQDKDNNIWIGTFTGGIDFISNFPERFKLITKEQNKNALSYNKVWGMCEDKSGRFWIGTDGGGINVYNAFFEKIKEINRSSGLTDNAVISALCDSEGTLWFGTYQGGLNYIAPQSFSVHPYTGHSLENGDGINNIRVIYEDNKRSIWLGTDAGGLLHLDKKTNIYRAYNTKNSGISYDAIRAIIQDKDGLFWIGTYGEGLNRFDEQRSEFKIYRHSNANKNSLCSNTVQALHFDKSGRLWIGTKEGICLFIPEKESFLTFTEQDGLINNNVVAILEDNDGNLWLSTNRGISKFNYNRKSFENYDLRDGLQTGQYFPGSALVSSQGLMFFGGTNGLNVFKPEQVTKTTFEPHILFTDFMLFNQPVSIRDEKNSESPLTKSISISDHIKLKHTQSVFTFDFVALNYSYPEKTQYKYILEGAEKSWNNVGEKHSATYRNLKPGKYIFRVKATNQDGVWTSYSKDIEVVILPAIWQTWWAKCVYVLIFVACIYGLLQLYTFRMRTLNLLTIERMERRKSEEINQAKLQFFTNISHEFRTPLTLIIGPLEKMIASEADLGKKKQFNMMHRNANRLLRLMNQLLDFRKTERGQMRPKVQCVNLVDFINDIVFSFEELSHQKNIVLRFEHANSTLDAWFDPEFIDKILFNLLSNAYKFTPGSGNITIQAGSKIPEKGNEYIEISVIDNGLGISDEDQKKIFERFYQVANSDSAFQKGSGIGLHLAQMLITLHHGIISVQSSPGKGSRFTICFPRDKKMYPKEEISEETDYKTVLSYPLSSVEEEVFTQKHLKQIEAGRAYSLLIVEDDDDIRQYLCHELSDNYIIHEAINGLEGIQKAAHFQPDLIISDVMMPELDGIEMCQRLKTELSTSHIPIILLTAKTSIENRIAGLETGADSYIPKPFHPQHLKVRIAKLIELREHLKQKFSKSINFEVKEVVATSPDEEFLRKAILFINKNISNPDYNGDLLGQDLGMSRANLYRKLKALLNQSSGEFIRSIRLKQAAQLLVQNKLSISEICYEVGFSSPSYFSSCFTNHFKMSPTEYMLRNTHTNKQS